MYGRAVKKDLQLAVLHSAELLQDGDQFHFIVDRIQAQAELGNEVMSIDEIGHG